MPDRSGGIGLKSATFTRAACPIARSQVTSAAIALPGAAEGCGLVGVVAQPDGRRGDRRGLGGDDAPGRAVVHDLERPAGVGRGDHRLAGEERLVRAEPEVLVDRRVERREAGRVEIGELRRVGRGPAKRTRPVERRGRATSCSSRSRSGPSPATTTWSDGSQRGRLDQQVDPLRRGRAG